MKVMNGNGISKRGAIRKKTKRERKRKRGMNGIKKLFVFPISMLILTVVLFKNAAVKCILTLTHTHTFEFFLWFPCLH